jgi:hypothetical protein
MAVGADEMKSGPAYNYCERIEIMRSKKRLFSQLRAFFNATDEVGEFESDEVNEPWKLRISPIQDQGSDPWALVPF